MNAMDIFNWLGISPFDVLTVLGVAGIVLSIVKRHKANKSTWTGDDHEALYYLVFGFGCLAIVFLGMILDKLP